MDRHLTPPQGPDNLHEWRRRSDATQKQRSLDVARSLFKQGPDAQLQASAEASKSFYPPSETEKSYEGDEQERLLHKLELPLKRQKKFKKQIEKARKQELSLKQHRENTKLGGHTTFERAQLTVREWKSSIWIGLLEMHLEANTKEISLIHERIDDLQAL
jgi:hypothetical protein